MPNLDEIGKKVFEDETPLATRGALTFRRDPTSSLQSAESDGLLLANSLGQDLSQLPAPWCFFPKDQPEVLLELKMRGDHTDLHAVHRALLQRNAWEFDKRDKAHRAGLSYDHEIPIWFVSAHFPRWLQIKAKFNFLEKGCYRYRSTFFDWYWIVSNELPKEEALIPFLLTRDGEPLEEFFKWVTPIRTLQWVLPVLKVFRMDKNFIKEVMKLAPPEKDPRARAQWAEIAKTLLDEDPDLKEEVIGEASRKAKLEGAQEAEARTLKSLLELKLQRALSVEEEATFARELTRIGTLGVSQFLLASDKKALSQWLSPNTPPKFLSPKKPPKK